MDKIKTEICIDTIESAIIAEEVGADQIELCQALNAGGLTPSAGFIKEVREKVDIKINMMIRPRSGDFHYSDYEKELMLEDIRYAKKMGVDGIVVGALLPDGSVDKQFMAKCIETSGNLPVTFHRAFDMVKNLEKSLEEIIDLGFARILTSGGANSAFNGKDNIKKLFELANGRISIMAGAGVNKENVKELIQYTGIKEVHFSAKEELDSLMEYRNPNVNMGGTKVIPEYEYDYTSKKKAKDIIDILNN